MPNNAGKMRKLMRRNRRTGFGPRVCFYCGAGKRDDDPLTVEHLLARSRGGTGDDDNLRLAHQSCNAAVGSLSVESKLKLAGKMERGRLPEWAIEEVRALHARRLPPDAPTPEWLQRIIDAADRNPRWAKSIAEAADETFIKHTSGDET